MTEPRIPNLLLTVGEVAVALRISTSYAKKLVANDEVRSVKVGRCRRIRTADLSAYVVRLKASDVPGSDPSKPTGAQAA